MIQVRRPDDEELCGFVDGRDGEWHSLTIFGGRLGIHDHRDDAEREVLDVGLASLAERWVLIDAATGEEQVVCIQQASPSSVTLALDYYSLPGVPTTIVAASELASGRWQLRRR
jgi:hypothetical protein